MSLDTKYRPRRYEDVLGQEATVAILREYVASGRGFRQSYLFAGGHGSGKTTLGRILARALLCDAPVKGGPCDQCFSCRTMLETGGSADFSEVDAATNSGKADMIRITDELQYQSFSGKRRIYLFDEAHQLTKDALDAMLKPLEEDLAGSHDKKLVCIFCTTEPEKMRVTILSRCAPAFVIRPQPPEVIAERLALVCTQEGITFEPEALGLIAEITESHIRDALKAIEGVSMLGSVTVENAKTYLHLDLNLAYLDVLDALGSDLTAALKGTQAILQRVSPKVCYERFADVAMLAFRASLGEAVPTYWNAERLVDLGRRKGAVLLGYASRFANRIGYPTASMLLCDVAHLHYAGGSVRDPSVVLTVAAPAPASSSAPSPAPSAGQAPAAPQPVVPASVAVQASSEPAPSGKVEWDPLLGEVPQRACRQANLGEVSRHVLQPTTMTPDEWALNVYRARVDFGGSS